jgi:hypothetical protein
MADRRTAAGLPAVSVAGMRLSLNAKRLAEDGSSSISHRAHRDTENALPGFLRGKNQANNSSPLRGIRFLVTHLRSCVVSVVLCSRVCFRGKKNF